MPLLIVGEFAAQIGRFYSGNFGGLAHQLVSEPFFKTEVERFERVLFFDVRQKIEREFGLELLHRRALEVIAGNGDAIGIFGAQLPTYFAGGVDRS